jgi:hypothetical protein
MNAFTIKDLENLMGIKAHQNMGAAVFFSKAEAHGNEHTLLQQPGAQDHPEHLPASQIRV